MKKFKFLLLLLFVGVQSFSQTYIEGFIFDKKTNESLPNATIKIISSNTYYTITNKDGKFEISDRFLNDTLEVRYIGFKTKKAPISYFSKHKKLFLTPNIYALNTVVVNAKKDKGYTLNLLNSLIQKYRKIEIETESKAFFTLTSSARGIPIEIVEGFYNSVQSVSKGIVDLHIKSGRFGQNKSFPFYSLNNTDILKNFQLFKKTPQILPQYPGNLTQTTIKGKYIVKIDQCASCSLEDMSISFVPKKQNGRLFSGTIIFNKESLTIKKIELHSNNPVTKGLTSIIEKDEMKPKEIVLTINFNPIDFTKIQSIDFKFVMYYTSDNSLEIIQSNSFLYFYDYNTVFKAPYFTNNIQFNNDYDKIIALQSSKEFWDANYQFPKSFDEQQSIDFFKKYGYLINYDTSIPTTYFKYVKPSIITWNRKLPLDWLYIKNSLSGEKTAKEIDHRNNQGETKAADNISYSISGLKNRNNSSNFEAYNFSYVLDLYFKNDEKKYTTRTIFDRKTSFCSTDRTQNKLTYITIIFDIYEIYNQKLKAELSSLLTFEEAKKLSDQLFEEATKMVNTMKTETEDGSRFQKLIKWKNATKEKLEANK